MGLRDDVVEIQRQIVQQEKDKADFVLDFAKLTQLLEELKTEITTVSETVKGIQDIL